MKKLIPLAAILMAISSCVKTGADIPNVAVSFADATTDPRLSALNVPGGAVLIDGYGVAGLILYREAAGTYACYDRCSPVKSPATISLRQYNITVSNFEIYVSN